MYNKPIEIFEELSKTVWTYCISGVHAVFFKNQKSKKFFKVVDFPDQIAYTINNSTRHASQRCVPRRVIFFRSFYCGDEKRTERTAISFNRR